MNLLCFNVALLVVVTFGGSTGAAQVLDGNDVWDTIKSLHDHMLKYKFVES